MKTSLTFLLLFAPAVAFASVPTSTRSAMASVPEAVKTSLEKGVAGRVRIADYRPTVASDCNIDRAEPLKRVNSSSRLAVKIFGSTQDGRACQGWAWVRVQLFQTVFVTTRALAEGEPFAGASTREEREVEPGRTPIDQIAADTTAARSLRAGQLIESHMVHQRGIEPGQPITVIVRAGALTIEEQAHSVACTPGHFCALLPSGKRVEGTIENGHLLVELP